MLSPLLGKSKADPFDDLRKKFGSPIMRGSTFNRRSPMSTPSATPLHSPNASPVMMFTECHGTVESFELPDALSPQCITRQTSSGSDQSSRFHKEEESALRRISIGLIYGMVNFVICVPTLVSYTQIVFNEPEFKEVVPMLVKLYFLSSALHQLAFSMRSTLEFAVGQIQDVGLIFLAAMVRKIVKDSRAGGLPEDVMISTCLYQCAGSTVFTGLCVILVGKFKLSEYVQMIPKPVVGGYLGYIGYFCLVAGLQISTNLELETPEKLLLLFDSRLVARLALLVVFTIILVYINFRVEHFIVMPIALLLLPVLFFLALPILGVSIQDCQDGGWLPQPTQTAAGLEVFSLFDITKVEKKFIHQQFINVVGLVIVVAFGSSLDVAAVQEARPSEKLDYNNELVTVGIGNLLSGVTGGATGSYIFSQTVFSAKKGVLSRSNGFVVFLGELILFFAPFDLLHYLPNAYVGAIMVLFGIDIMGDWLLFSRHSMAAVEYCMVWISFVVVMWLTSLDSFGVIEGMIASTIVAAFVFSINYAMAHSHWQVIRGQSSVVRPWGDRQKLVKESGAVLTIGLGGYAFFLSSFHLAQGIEREVSERKPRFVCLDFSRLQGLDSTAAAQLKYLLLSLERIGSEVLLSSIHAPWLQKVLRGQDIWGTEAANRRKSFDTLDATLQYCEEVLLGQSQRKTTSEEKQLERLLFEYVEGFGSSQAQERDRQFAIELAKHFEKLTLSPGEVLFREQDRADYIFVVVQGLVQVSCMPLSYSQRDRRPSFVPVHPLQRQAELTSEAPVEGMPGGNWAIPENVGPGAILGDTAYYCCLGFGCNATAAPTNAAGPCVVRRISRRSLESLEAKSPNLVAFLQRVLLRDLTQYQVQFLEPAMVAHGFV